MSTSPYNDVTNFMIQAGQTNPKPEDFTCTYDLDLRQRLVKEEADEFLEAQTPGEKIDAIIDLIYVSIGTLVAWNVPFGSFWELVHEANMEKVLYGEKDSGGKILKPIWWTHPPVDEVWQLMEGTWKPSEVDVELMRYLLRAGKDNAASIVAYPPLPPYRLDNEKAVDTDSLRRLTFLKFLDFSPAKLSGPAVWTASDQLRAWAENNPSLMQ